MNDHELFVAPTGPGFIRRPIIGIAIAFVSGTALGLFYSSFGLVALLLGVIFLIVGCVLRWLCLRNVALQQANDLLHLLAAAAICACACFLGWAAASTRVAIEREFAVPAEILAAEQVEIEGWVVDYPRPLASGFERLNSWLLHFRMQRVRVPKGKWIKVEGELRVFWNERVGSRKPQYGDVWKLRRIAGSALAAESGRTYRYDTVRVYGRQTRYVSSGYGSKIKAWRYKARALAADHLQIGIEDFSVESNIFHALLLGYRSRLPREIKEMGAATGTMHIFAVSGLHVGLIAGLLIGALSALRISRIHWVYFLAPMLIAYTLLTGARPSAVRACIMAIIYFLGPAIGRRSDAPSALALAALVILAWDPNQLKDIGFIYSFAVVIGLITFYPLFWDAMKPLWKTDPMRAKTEKWRSFLTGCIKYIVGLLAISCAAWLTSMPLTAYFFGRLTPIAVLANLVVIPLAFIIVLSGCLSLVLGAVLEVFAELFNHAAVAAIRMFMVSIDAISHVPFASVEIQRPALQWIVLCYIALSAAAFLLWHRRISVKAASLAGANKRLRMPRQRP